MPIFARRAAKRARTSAPMLASADLGGGEMELVLYGDVAMERERDWWTGQVIESQMITAEEVNAEIEKLRGASHVTVRLNSCGGDAYAGLAIRNALKSLGVPITVRIEGIAASAASVIACAGDEVVAMPGSIFMIHEAATFAWGYLGRSDLEEMLAGVEGTNRAILDVYVAKCKRSRDEIAEMMAAETWMVGSEIVNEGFADAYEPDQGADGGSDGVGEADPDDGSVTVNGVRHDFSAFRNVPADLAARIRRAPAAAVARTEPPAEPSAVANTDEPPMAAAQEVSMDINEMRSEHPDLVAQIEAEAAQRERERIAEIDEIAAGVPADMVASAKYGERPMTAQELAFEAMKAQRAAGAKYLADAQSDAEESGAGDVDPDPNGADEQGGDERQAMAEVAEAAAFLNKMGVMR